MVSEEITAEIKLSKSMRYQMVIGVGIVIPVISWLAAFWSLDFWLSNYISFFLFVAALLNTFVGICHLRYIIVDYLLRIDSHGISDQSGFKEKIIPWKQIATCRLETSPTRYGSQQGDMEAKIWAEDRNGKKLLKRSLSVLSGSMIEDLNQAIKSNLEAHQ